MVTIIKYKKDFALVQDTESNTFFDLSVANIDNKAKEGDVLTFDYSLGYYVTDKEANQ